MSGLPQIVFIRILFQMQKRNKKPLQPNKKPGRSRNITLSHTKTLKADKTGHCPVFCRAHDQTRRMMSESQVSYCCSSCRYPLNLVSSSEDSSRSSGHNKPSKKGFVSFLTVDLSRFTQVDEVKCLPISFGRNCLKTKLLCRKCGEHVGYGYEHSSGFCGLRPLESCKRFSVKTAAIQPGKEC